MSICGKTFDELCDAGVCSRKIIYMFFWSNVLACQNFSTGILSDTINVINVKLCVMVLLVELHLFIPLSVTLTILYSHSNVEQF